jgi:hypothetical protein
LPIGVKSPTEHPVQYQDVSQKERAPSSALLR